MVKTEIRVRCISKEPDEWERQWRDNLHPSLTPSALLQSTNVKWIRKSFWMPKLRYCYQRQDKVDVSVWIFPCSPYTFCVQVSFSFTWHAAVQIHFQVHWPQVGHIDSATDTLFCKKGFKWNKTKLLNQLFFISNSAQIVFSFKSAIKWRINQSSIYKNHCHQQEV